MFMSVSDARRAAVSLTDLVLLGVFAIGCSLSMAVGDLVSDNPEVVKFGLQKNAAAGSGADAAAAGAESECSIYYT